MNRNRFHFLVSEMANVRELASLCFRRGFVLKNNNPYYSISGIWEYGHLGVLLRQNIKHCWWQQFVSNKPHRVGFEGSIINHGNVLSASGHIGHFIYRVFKCVRCHKETRVTDVLRELSSELPTIPEEMDDLHITRTALENNLKCENCEEFIGTDIRRYAFLFDSNIGPQIGKQKRVYWRPETAEGILVKLGKIAQIHKLQVPFSVAQMGYVFRNEIDPGRFLFRVRAFEQMELEMVVEPGLEAETIEYLIQEGKKWYQSLGVPSHCLRVSRYKKTDFSHALKADADLDVKFPFGWEDVLAITNRKDYDLRRHLPGNRSEIANLKCRGGGLPSVVELSTSVERAFLASISSAYSIEKDNRICLRFPFHLAPVKLVVLPLQKRFRDKAYELTCLLRDTLKWEVSFSVKGSIGKRYVEADEIGIPFCISFDDISAKGGAVLIRHLITRKQNAVEQADIVPYLLTRSQKNNATNK